MSIVRCKSTVKSFCVNDQHNPFKQHVFKLYRDHHLYYNQSINGCLFYRKFERCNRQHGCYEYFSKFVKQAILATGWQSARTWR